MFVLADGEAKCASFPSCNHELLPLSLRLSPWGTSAYSSLFLSFLSRGFVLLLLSWPPCSASPYPRAVHNSLDFARTHVLDRVIFDEDTKIPNAATLTINKEDHTLANMLRSCVPPPPPPASMIRRAASEEERADSDLRTRLPPSHRQLLLLPFVQFAGYRVPHPLEPRVELKVQTDGTKTPIVAVQEAINALIMLLSRVKKEFSQEVLKVKTLEGTEDQFGGAGEGFY